MYLYLYNGNESQSDFGLNIYDFNARYYDPAIGRFLQIDPLAEVAPDLTPYRFGFNNPILYNDPLGLFESRKAARQYAKENDIRTGWFSSSRISKQEDGSFAIVSTTVSEGNINQTFTQDFGGDIGVSTGVIVRANDKMDRDRGWFSDDITLRDGSVVNEGHKDVGLPVGGIAAKGGIIMAGGPRFTRLTTIDDFRRALSATFEAAKAAKAGLAWKSTMNAKEVIKMLKKAGFKKVGQDGSHKHFKLGGKGPKVTVPDHGTDIIKKGTLGSIKRQTKAAMNN